MAYLGEADPFDSLLEDGKPPHPIHTAALPSEGKAKVLAHNPFTSMGGGRSSNVSVSGSSISAMGTRQTFAAPSTTTTTQQQQQKQCSTAALATMGTRGFGVEHSQSVPAASPQPKQEQQEEQHQQQQIRDPLGLTPKQRPLLVSQGTVERAGAAPVSQGTPRPAASSSAGAVTGFSCPRATATATTRRGPSVTSISSNPSTTDANHSITSTRRSSYFGHLLKKEPPEFLKPSPGSQARQRSSTGRNCSHSPLHGLRSTPHANGGSHIGSHPRSGSTGTNTDEQQRQQNQCFPVPHAAPRSPTPKERRCDASILSVTSAHAEKHNINHDDINIHVTNNAPIHVPSASHAALPRLLQTQAPPVSLSHTRDVGVSETLLPSESFAANATETSCQSSFVDERRLPIQHSELGNALTCGASMPRFGATMEPFADSESLEASASLLPVEADEPAEVLKDVKDASWPPPPRRGTLLPEEFRRADIGPSHEKFMLGEQKQLMPPPPPPSQQHQSQQLHHPLPSPAFASLPKSMEGVTMRLPLSAPSPLSRTELHTPRNGGMNLQQYSSLQRVVPLTQLAEDSPAPFPPSRQGSQEVHFGGDVTTPMATAESVMSSPNPTADTQAGKEAETEVTPNTPAFGEGPVPEGKPDVSQEEQVKDRLCKGTAEAPAFLGAADNTFSIPPSPLPSPRPPLPRVATDEPNADFKEETDAVLGAGTAVPQPPQLASTKEQPQQQQKQHTTRMPCFALFTSSGHVVTISNMPRQDASPILRSYHLADMLSGRFKSVTSAKSAEEHVKTLQVISASPLVSGNESDVSLTSLEDIVRRLPGVSPLLQEILAFMMRDPLPEWRTEGHKALIKMVSEAAEEVQTAYKDSHYPLGSEPAQNSAKGLYKVQQLLCTGEREKAVETALTYRLYSHAIIIAMMCPKKEHYMNVIRAVVQQELDPLSPLAHAYCIFNEMPLPPFAPPPTLPSDPPKKNNSCPLPILWLQHAAILLSNFTKKSAEGLIQLGDALANEGMIDEAHCCFLLAHLSPMGTPPPGRPLQPQQQHVMDLIRARLGILGGRYHPQRSRIAFVSPKSTHLTDVLHCIRCHLESRTHISLGEECNKQPVVSGLPVCPDRYRAAFRYMQLLWLQEVGLHEEAMPLIAALRRVVPPASATVPQFTLNRLIGYGSTAPVTCDGLKQIPLSHVVQPSPSLAVNQRTPPVPSLTSVIGASHVPPGDDRTTHPTHVQPSKQSMWTPQTGAPPMPGPPKMGAPPMPGPPKMGAPPLPGPPKLPQRAVSEASSLKGPNLSPPPGLAQPKQLPAVPNPAFPSPMSNSEHDINDATKAVEDKQESSTTSHNSSSGHLHTRGRAAESKQQQPQPARRSRSLEAITSFLFRRGRSQDTKKDEAKTMIIDTEKPPKFDPVTGRYLFEETEEEKKAADLVKAGPPKPSSMAAKGPAAAGVSTPSMLRPPVGATGGPTLVGGKSLPRAQYVDMFNST
ncbi:hypothetical protein DQ04_00341070 [Trypanosoma grayi]|uniref:hypothetical protein n=1 Tax=Trypanosoma grayi TaxID=71804 RepID=UPI0004F46666|nr:hypothetical protein DQ04_00341070 [Trypanosoma grayi]KEG14692.1 hypothetical protein DQ04_00341070 [Trypanosoma grayi]